MKHPLEKRLCREWGSYLSERQWGTGREDYSPNGNAWNYFAQDQPRSRAFHWGEMESPASAMITSRFVSRSRFGMEKILSPRCASSG